MKKQISTSKIRWHGESGKINALLPNLMADIERYSQTIGCPHSAKTWGCQLKYVVGRVVRVSHLDERGRELAFRAYLGGVMSGMYGANSAIACGLRLMEEKCRRLYEDDHVDEVRLVRLARRIQQALIVAGDRDGREVMLAREQALLSRQSSGARVASKRGGVSVATTDPRFPLGTD
ncbi:hypothetical protein ACS0Y3_16840 [Burkholderia gladioli]|uniref:hypothetical protein n=1 Tax=Burkholderia gladioli TaxID=28095 RepID=UPI003F791CBB